MSDPVAVKACQDPAVPDWCDLVLPDAWPDMLDFRSPAEVFRLLRQTVQKKRPAVELPAGMPGAQIIPKYVLREFHNLPNGNYSKRITRGYITGFEAVMMGSMDKARKSAAEHMRGFDSVLDIGCAGGRMAHALSEAQIDDVWGLDPSPYMLQHASRTYPTVKFVQGIAEQTAFPNNRFDGVTACFLLHELPPRSVERTLAECHRILKPGGLLTISEPSPRQLSIPLLSLLWREGISGFYFGALARLVHEPFVVAWHKQDLSAKFAEFGFELIQDSDQMPIRQWVVRKVGN